VANASRRQKVEKAVAELGERLSIWWEPPEYDYTRYGMAMTAYYLVKEINKSVLVSLYFAWDRPLSDVRIMFLGKPSQHLNRRLNLREKISQEVLEILEQVCIQQDCFEIYITQIAAA